MTDKELNIHNLARKIAKVNEVLEACKYANKCDELDDCSREEYEDMTNANESLNVENYDLKEENQELKKQLEDKEDYINKLQATKDKLDKWDYENTMQQKEFINYLEDLIKKHEAAVEASKLLIVFYKEILQKYKSTIGENKDEK